EKLGRLQRSAQSREFLKHSKSSAEKQKKAGFLTGTSRLAIHTSEENHSCQYCGLCVFGCPYSSIYSTLETLEQLKKKPQFTYLGGKIAIHFTETLSQVKLKVLNLEDNLE